MKKWNIKYLIIINVLVFLSCSPEDPLTPDDPLVNRNFGTIEFDFEIPARSSRISGIHRIDLSLAKSAYDLYRGDFLISTNVSDKERFYVFKLEPGDYYFQAGITCACFGDTCLWEGFPGGRFGTKWTMDKITIHKGEKISKHLTFNQ
jgi:hypothetical protein